MVCVIFDLDGTLLDTSPGIVESIRYAAEKNRYPELSQEQLGSFIGPPLVDSFIRCYGCNETEAWKLTATYREHYRKGALLNAKPYDGIFDLCEKLKERGYQLAVATSKPQAFSEHILNHFGFDIQIIHGADMEGKLTKADLIRLCINDSGVNRAVMIGDTKHDAKGAEKAGVPFIAVTYGFGNIKEILKYPHIGVADTPLDILKILEEREDGVDG